MNGLTIFNYGGKAVRTVTISGKLWWILKDVCDILDLNDTNKVTERIDAEDLTRIKLVSGGQTREMYAINESGLYNVILLSRKPEAKKFKYWVTHEVLPSIRKHGVYAMDELLNNPDTLISVLTALKEERAKATALAEENDTLEIALNTSLRFYTVAKYNRQFNGGKWNLKQCQDIGKNLSAYCRSNAIEIRKCETNDERFDRTNSYPLTAWEEFLKARNDR